MLKFDYKQYYMDFSQIDLSDNQDLAREIVIGALEQGISDRRSFEKFRNSVIKKRKGRIFHNLYFIKAYNDLVKEGSVGHSAVFLSLIQKRSVRTMSGVAPVTVLTKPFPCPGRCVYCPTDVRMPKSYLPSQPAAQRAFRQQFNPYTQVFVRLKALNMTGHEVSKVELRIIGGTFSSYPKDYREWFVRQCLIAMNEFNRQLNEGVGDKISDHTVHNRIVTAKGIDDINTVILQAFEPDLVWDEVIAVNESADVRCIGVNIETRPDFIDEKEVIFLRSLGVTKVEMGVQTTDDDVQRITKRGHDLQSVVDATRMLKDAGFKIGYHMMPNLPGSNPELDKKIIHDLFKDDLFQPDYLKIYPCVVLPGTELEDMMKRGEYKSYSDDIVEEVLYDNLKSIPEWCRVDRVARDIPSDELSSGFKVSNIRQVLEERFKAEGAILREIRSREVGAFCSSLDDVSFVSRSYESGGAIEFFLSFEDVKNDKLLALLRLRLTRMAYIPEIKDSAIIREVHVYGKQVAVGEKGSSEKRQHTGFGRRLIKQAEELAISNGYTKMAIIAGIGTRPYYKKLGYVLSGTYMVKSLE